MAFDIQKARENLQRRHNERQADLHALFARAGADANRIVSLLIEKYHPRRIYQWGSLLAPSRFREWSDIDIAVEGLAGPLDGLDAIDDAGLLTTFPVDLVELERIHPEHAQTIRVEGKLVYERTYAGR
jgi:predicted nucleotidyltransferase